MKVPRKVTQSQKNIWQRIKVEYKWSSIPIDGHEKRCRSSAESCRNAGEQNILCRPGLEPVVQHVDGNGQDQTNQGEHHRQFPSVLITPRSQKEDDQHRRNVLYEWGAHAQIGYVALNVIVLFRLCRMVVWSAHRGIEMEVDQTCLLQEQILHNYGLTSKWRLTKLD